MASLACGCRIKHFDDMICSLLESIWQVGIIDKQWMEIHPSFAHGGMAIPIAKYWAAAAFLGHWHRHKVYKNKLHHWKMFPCFLIFLIKICKSFLLHITPSN